MNARVFFPRSTVAAVFGPMIVSVHSFPASTEDSRRRHHFASGVVEIRQDVFRRDGGNCLHLGNIRGGDLAAMLLRLLFRLFGKKKIGGRGV